MGANGVDAPLAYDEFGVPLAGVMGKAGNPFGFTGYQSDSVSGLCYAQARYYQPTMGRFAAEDGIQHGLNWYIYCKSNPLRFFDPIGLAEYQRGGLESAPKITHDAGFPYDPHAVPTEEDEKSWNKWGTKASLAGFAPWLQDAAKAYKHFRNNTGTDMWVDYERAYRQDKVIKCAIDQEIEKMKQFAESELCNDTGSSFEMIGTAQKISNPATENWQKTIGKHRIYGHGVVTTNGDGTASMDITFYMQDMYNFNPGQADIKSGTKDAVNGRFSELGWASEFKTYGTFKTTIPLNNKAQPLNESNGQKKR